MKDTKIDHQHRDAKVLQILGAFFSVLGTLVLIGTVWCWGNFRAVVVNIVCGAVLVSIGVGMILAARRLFERKR